MRWFALGVTLAACGANEPPQFHLGTQLENVAQAGPFEVWVDVSDDAGLSRVELLYRTRPLDGAAPWSDFVPVPMEELGARAFRAEVPALAEPTEVEYEVAALDDDGAIARFPGDDALARFRAGCDADALGCALCDAACAEETTR